MPHHGEWLIPLRVVYVRMWGVVTASELNEYSNLGVKFLREAQAHHPQRLVYLLLDNSEVESLPLTYLMISQALPVLRFQNRGPVFVVTANQMFKTMVRLTALVMHFPLHIFSDKGEALRAIEATMLKDDLKISHEVC